MRSTFAVVVAVVVDVLLVVGEAPTVARAQTPPVLAPMPDPTSAPGPAPAPASASRRVQAEVPRRVSLTLSPLHLLAGPVLEVTGEYALTARVGVAVVAGGGRYTLEDEAGTSTTTANVVELGLSLRWYAVGDFEGGVQLGVEALWIHVASDDVNGTELAGTGRGLAVGPMIGYKWVGEAGFTFDAQGGLAVAVVRAEVEGSTGEESRTVPIVNLNLGWSF